MHEYITLQGILSLLGGAKQKRGSEYICTCPAHSDHKPSLWVSEGDKGIIMKCRANTCSTADICKALGIKEAQLFREPLPASGRGSRKQAADKPAPAAQPKPAKPQKTFDSYQAAYGHIGKLVKVYPYTDGSGRLLFEVARIRLPDGDKTFRQHRPAYPEKGKFPIVCNVPAEIRQGVLYRQMEVDAAVRDGRTVYVVEGEKDADTLAGMGYAATTCPGGAKSWTPAHSEKLHGADVVILPDNDGPGEAHGQQVADATLPEAKRVRLVRLAESYQQLPPKGDITDLVELVGRDQAQAILDNAVAQAKPVAVELYKLAVQTYDRIPGYCVVNGCICQSTEDGPRMLGTFVALPVGEITRDDGTRETMQLEIAGWSRSGRPFKRLYVDMDKFTAMSWATNSWGLAANIMPGTTIKDKLRFVIATAGEEVAKRRTIYEHTGWRQINGKWAFLHSGGCIGADDVSVELEGSKAQMYAFGEGAAKIDPTDAAITSWSLVDICARHISVPLLGLMYLAPLREFMSRGVSVPSFLTMVKGRSKTRKSTVAGLFMAHFGDFNHERVPASFQDTANSIRRMAFIMKDMPLLVDDYHPVSSIQEQRKIETIMQNLARAFGNNSDRARMDANLRLQAAMPPRSLALMTGEQVPEIGESGVNRMYVIDVNKGDVPLNEELTDMQRRAHAGELQAAMRGYIEWLIPQADTLPERLDRLFYAYRDKATAMLGDEELYNRATPMVAHIMTGLTVMMYYFESLGLTDHDGAAECIEDYWKVVCENCRKQALDTAEINPVQMYVQAVRELLASETVAVVDTAPGAKAPSPNKIKVGYADASNYYFIAGLLHGQVCAFYSDQQRIFPLGMAEIHKQLRASKVVEQIGSDGKVTRPKRINGKLQRFLWIPRWQIDGTPRPEPDSVQESMDLYTEVSDEELPEEFKEQEDSKE